MKVELHLIEETSIEQFADNHGLVMVVRERPNDRRAGLCRFYAQFKGAEIKEDCFLVGMFGDGNTPEDAIYDYSKRISRKLLVVDAMANSRREIQVQKLI